MRRSAESRMALPHFSLLRLPSDIRRLIYASYYPMAKHIKLTSGPVSETMAHEDFTICRLSSEAINLMRVCRQINDEVSAVLYGTNTFSMVPSESLPLRPHRTSLRWLYHLRPSTKRMVKKLDIHIELPMYRRCITLLASGVSTFPTLEIRVLQNIVTFDEGRVVFNRQENMKELTEICNGVMEARGSAQTTWNDMGFSRTKLHFCLLHVIGSYYEAVQTCGSASRWTVSGDEFTQRKTRDQRSASEILYVMGLMTQDASTS